jgi:hypothetical protein
VELIIHVPLCILPYYTFKLRFNIILTSTLQLRKEIISRKVRIWLSLDTYGGVSMCMYSVFMLSCVQLAALPLADPPSKESY